MQKNPIILLILCFSCVSTTFADRGLIPVNPAVRIFEPNQRAMLAWNGNEEILLLSTDIYASDSTLLLEVLPLPAEPEVKKGDLETFRKATTLINKKLQVESLKRNGGEDREGIKTPGGEVTFHKRIGAHDISVTHLLDSNGFMDWVREYLRTLDVTDDVISDRMKELIEEYVDDGFEWFVFDVVSIGKEVATNEPIQYRFPAASLYYPMRITSTGEGRTSIELLVLTTQLLRNFPGLPIQQVKLQHDPIVISIDELKELNRDMYDMFSEEFFMKLRIWKIEGELTTFTEDLIAY